jgi:hypothetical protein
VTVIDKRCMRCGGVAEGGRVQHREGCDAGALEELHFGAFRTASELADAAAAITPISRAPLPLAEYRVTVLLPEGPVPNEAADEALALVEQVVFTALPRMLAAAAIPLGPGVRVIVEVADED